MYRKLPKVDSNTIALIDFRGGKFNDYANKLSWQKSNINTVKDNMFGDVWKGTNNVISTTLPNSLITNKPRTIEIWFKLTSTTNKCPLFEQGYPVTGSGTSNTEFSILIDGKHMVFHTWHRDYDFHSSIEPTAGVWHHTCLSYDGSNVYFLYDGILLKKYTNFSSNADGKFVLGSCSDIKGLPANCQISVLRFSNIVRYTSNFNVDDIYPIEAKGLITSKTPINLLDKSNVKGFTIAGIQPANTNRKVAFKVDNKWNKLTTNGVLSPLPTQAITSDSVLAEGNTVSELTALTNVPSFVGKMVYPAFALYASNEATAMPTIGMTVKAEIDTTSTSTSTNYTYAYTDYSQEFELSKDDNIDVRLISVACKTTLKGNGTVNITARIKQNDTWSDYQSLDKIQLTLCSAVQLKYDYKVAVTDGTDSAKVDEVVIKYNNSGAITSHLETDIVTVTEKFTNDLAYAHAYIKHAPLVDAEMKVYCAIRKRPKRREMYQFANGTGALHTYTLPDSGVNHDTLRIYVDNKKLMDFDYNTKTSEVTFTAEKGTVLSATYEYGWEKSEWYEMNLVNTQINDSGTYTTEYDYIVPSHEGDYTVTAIKYHLIRPEGKVTNAVIGVGTGRRQIIRLPHYAKSDTIVCNVIWSYDYDSKCITVIAPEGDNIVISYDWIAESPQVYGVMAGWAD